ncbi:ABC transporter ATP-binding protein [Thermoplasmatales archaeon AK]|nr:ABC transporter ATP-binding protein [Thermoplasmatales archaeon AK]
MYDEYVLYVENLTVEYSAGKKRILAINNVTFGIRKNESIGIVGESGCGKSTLAMAIGHILPQNSRVISGRIFFNGQIIVDREMGASFSIRYNKKERKIEESLKMVRWKGISIVFQGALDSLNPLIRVGEQLSDIFIYKENEKPEKAKERSLELLRAVGLDGWIYDAFPHQLSGGMKQRVVIAMALTIIEELSKLKNSYNVSILNISHDVSMVSRLSDKIMVMYAGRIVEKLPSNDFGLSQHPYTYMLIESIPKLLDDVSEIVPIRGAPPSLSEPIIGCPFYERCDFHIDLCREESSVVPKVLESGHEVMCILLPLRTRERTARQPRKSGVEYLSVTRDEPVVEVAGITKKFSRRAGLRESSKGKGNEIIALDEVTLSIYSGESVGLVGETGSGKTTLSRIIGLLETPTSGKLTINGKDVDFRNQKELKRLRRTIQTIFQDPFQSINPKFSIYDAVEEPLIVNRVARDPKNRESMVKDALAKAELLPAEDYMDKFPHQLSGGQRQRVSIARAIIMNPKILIADEPISMLDVSLRAGILNLLKKLRQNLSISILYITHDIASARYVSDRIYVLYKGQIVESGSTEEIIRRGTHPYTIALMISSIGIRGEVSEELGEKIFNQTEPAVRPRCLFEPRCPLAQKICSEEVPPVVRVSVDHDVKCHFAERIYNFGTGSGMPDLRNLRSALRN